MVQVCHCLLAVHSSIYNSSNMKMGFLVSLGLVPVLLGSMIAATSQIKVAYRWQFETNEQSISTFDAAGYVLAIECSSALAVDRSAANSISFDVDPSQPSNGTISIGSDTYPFLWDDATSSPNCGLAYSKTSVHVECSFAYALPASLNSNSAKADCFTVHSASARMVQVPSWHDKSRTSQSNVA